MKNWVMTLVICLLFISYGKSQTSTMLSIEQNALDYFITNIRQHSIYYGVFKKFNPDSSIVYVRLYTSAKIRMTPDEFNYKTAKEFFSLKDSLDYRKELSKDTTKHDLSIANYLNVKSSKEYTKESFGKYDIYIVLTSRFYYNGSYFIRIFISPKEDWFANDAYIKLDKDGNPVDIKFRYGEF